MKIIDILLEKIKSNQFVSKLLKNVMISFVGEGGASVFSFMATIVLIRSIGSAGYGLITIASTYVFIVDYIINFQSWQAVVKFGSEDIANNEYTSLEKLIKVCSIIDFITAFLGGIFAIFAAPIVIRLMNWSNDLYGLIVIMSIQVFFNFTGTSVGVVRLLDRFKYYSAYRIISEGLKLILVFYLCVIKKEGLVGAAAALAISYSLGYILFIFLFIDAIRKEPHLSLKRIITCKVRDKWKQVLGFTIWTNLTMSADIPVQHFDVMFLSMISNEMVAVFKVYKQIGTIVNKLIIPLRQAIMPLYAEYVAKKKYAECYSYLVKMKNKSLMIMLPLVTVGTLISIPILRVVLGDLYAKYWYILYLYLLLRTYALAYATVHTLFVALGMVKLDFIYTLGANIAYIAITGLLIKKVNIWAILMGMAVQYISSTQLKSYQIRKICVEGAPLKG